MTAIKWSIVFAQKMLYDSDFTEDVILSEGREALETLAALLTGKREEARMSARIPIARERKRGNDRRSVRHAETLPPIARASAL